jgi:hypothetical protein
MPLMPATMLPPVRRSATRCANWKERRDLLGYTVEELREVVQEGMDSGPSSRTSMTDVKAEARRRFEASRRDG